LPDASAFKFGKLAPVRFDGHPMLAAHVKRPWTALPAPFDNSEGVQLELDGNGPDPNVTNQGPDFQGVGNCGVVGGVNARRTSRVRILGDSAIAATILAHVTKISLPDANQVVADYLRYTRGQDTGVALVQFLEYWRRHGLDGHKIIAWATVDHTDPVEFYNATHDFDVTYNGYQLASTFMRQAQALIEGGNEPIDCRTSRFEPIGGHCMVEAALTLAPTPSGHPFGKLGTWGYWLPRTEEFRTNCQDESHVIITPEIAAAKSDGLNCDLDQLIATCDQLNGVAA